MYRVAERAHILCTASWSQVAKCVPIHSLNITTYGSGHGNWNVDFWLRQELKKYKSPFDRSSDEKSQSQVSLRSVSGLS